MCLSCLNLGYVTKSPSFSLNPDVATPLGFTRIGFDTLINDMVLDLCRVRVGTPVGTSVGSAVGCNVWSFDDYFINEPCKLPKTKKLQQTCVGCVLRWC